MLRNKYLLFNWIFVTGVLLLLLNDHYLKWLYPGWITGKLSDFIGLLIFPFFIAFVFPKINNNAVWIIALLFVFWKLPLSEPFMAFYNEHSILPIVRTVDYSDFIAILIMPLSGYLIKSIERFRIVDLDKKYIHPAFILIPCSFVFMSTSMPFSYYVNRPGGDVFIGKWYLIDMPKETVLNKLEEKGFHVIADTSEHEYPYEGRYYLVQDLIFDRSKDTIKTLKIGLKQDGNNQTRFIVNNVSFYGGKKTSDWRELKRYSKYYSNLIKTNIVEELKHDAKDLKDKR